MSINFESIVSHLFCDHVDRKYPENYFKRVFLKAQKEYYDADTFFNSCLDVIDFMEYEMDFQFYHVHPGYITEDIDEPTKDFAEQLIKTPHNNFDFQLIRNIDNKKNRIIVYCEDFLIIKDAINATYKDAKNSEKINSPDSSRIDLIDENQTKNIFTDFLPVKPLSNIGNNSTLTQTLNQGNILPKTKSEKLKENLSPYGFFILPLVKPLTIAKLEKLVEIISSSDLPYFIAMLNYLGFIKHLVKEHFKVKQEMYKEISKWRGSDKEVRSIKGNINTLNVISKENKIRYTAHLHIEKVKEDYHNL